MRAGLPLLRPLRVTMLATIMLPLVAATSLGQDAGRIEKDANEIYNSLLSPFCPGRLIANCPSPQAADLRSRIKDQLEAGVTKETIVDELYATWGEEVLGGRRGPVSYGVPIGVILLAGGLLVMWLRSASKHHVMRTTSLEGLDSESEKRLQEEMAGL